MAEALHHWVIAVGLLVGCRGAAPPACCWCDADTPASEHSTLDIDGHRYELVFSDEFDVLGRDFANGRDPRWTAINKSDYTNGSPMRYMPEAVTTVIDRGAYMRVSSNASIDDKEWREYAQYARPRHSLRITTSNITANKPLAKAVNKTFSGGMLQSWNKFCFTGGIIEISAKFPAGAGFWPALWLFGNLGRAIYKESNDGLWPYSLEECDEAYEAMEVPPPGLKQRISGCDPSPGFGLNPHQGRGATEIDIAEVADSKNGAGGWLTMSLQTAPSIPQFFRPPKGEMPRGYRQDGQTGRWALDPAAARAARSATWYRGLKFGGNESGSYDDDAAASGGAAAGGSGAQSGSYSANPPVKPFQNWYGAPYADAVAGLMEGLDDLSERYRKFRLEWQEGAGGYLRWFIDDRFAFEVGENALGKYTACGQSPDDEAFVCEHAPARTMPAEPMSIVLNSALGSWNGGADAARGSMPGHLYVDYVRVWQRPDRQNVGCDPPDHPTKQYIEAHPLLYGEPVLPRSEDTCRPVHPPSSRAAPPEPGSGPGKAAPSAAGAAGARASSGGGGGRSQLVVGLLLIGVCALVVLVGPRVAHAVRGQLLGGAAPSSHYSSVVDGADPTGGGGSSIRAPILGGERAANGARRL